MIVSSTWAAAWAITPRSWPKWLDLPEELSPARWIPIGRREPKRTSADYPNVTVQASDGAACDSGACDAMFINAGVTHPHVPWLERLNEGGRILLPITFPLADKGVGMGLMLKIVHDRGHFAAQVVSEVGIYSCTSVRDPRLEPLVGKVLATRALLRLQSVRLDRHEQADTCILHGEDVCLSAATSNQPAFGRANS